MRSARLLLAAFGANRVQFIAHYEVIYRVGLCPDRVVTSG